MKATATNLIIFFIILFIPIASSIDFTIDSPSSVEKDNEFNVEISSGETAEHDVKIFIYKDTKEFSEISIDDSWKSTHNYILSAFPSQKLFKLISHYAGNTKVCARLRESGKSAFSEVCKDIEVKDASQKENKQIEDNNKEEKMTNKAEKIKNSKQNNSQRVVVKVEDTSTKEDKIQQLPFSNNISNNYELTSIPLAPIKLSASPNIPLKSNSKPLLLLSLFTTFTIIIVILLALRKL